MTNDEGRRRTWALFFPRDAKSAISVFQSGSFHETLDTIEHLLGVDNRVHCSRYRLEERHPKKARK
jgi:hypothetical protein